MNFWPALFAVLMQMALGLLGRAESGTSARFVVTGAKEDTFTVGKTESSLFVRNRETGMLVWECRIGASTHGNDILFSVGPHQNNAILIHQYGVRGQSLFWVGLRRKPLDFVQLSTQTLEKIIADALGVNPEQLTDDNYEIRAWKSDRECILVWDCPLGNPDESSYNSGIVFISREGQSLPILTPGPHKLRMNFRQWKDLADQGYKSLIKGSRTR